MIPRIKPSPSPPPVVPLPQVSPDSSPGSQDRKRSNRPKNRASRGDAVLVDHMFGGSRPEIARQAGDEPLASPGEDDDRESSPKGTEVTVPKTELHDIAVQALMANEAHGPERQAQAPRLVAKSMSLAPLSISEPKAAPAEDAKPVFPSLTVAYQFDARQPRAPEPAIKSEPRPPPMSGGLPPLQRLSPQSGPPTGNVTLPSIIDQLGDINQLTEAPPSSDPSAFAQSPPARPPHRFGSISGHVSSPRSPNDTFRRELPSPGRVPTSAGSHPYFHHRQPSSSDSQVYSSTAEYASSSTETPSTDQSASTPAHGIDRMSIDGITNPQVGGFRCDYPGCTAPPFQTQVSLQFKAS